MTPKTYNWAILGCGKIARKFSSDLKLLPNARLYAAASRSMDKALPLRGNLALKKLMDLMMRWLETLGSTSFM
jgi:predicted dehydrogenase